MTLLMIQNHIEPKTLLPYQYAQKLWVSRLYFIHSVVNKIFQGEDSTPEAPTYKASQPSSLRTVEVSKLDNMTNDHKTFTVWF